ncbi:unnamed protein product [Trifolium pratense]|uniref:Uncharacterized protein n=1 Tax=Trifolium pratense TaxID=57577 RepID=A0ACB0IT78_TRIPR|nr:unnamed protein product [Trifolium pratense]
MEAVKISASMWNMLFLGLVTIKALDLLAFVTSTADQKSSQHFSDQAMLAFLYII